MKISVIIASYNYAQYIQEAIDSVINQSYCDWELIIVDDGSNDNSLDIIKSYCEKDERIHYFQHENGQNKGLKETLLLGLKHATGEWIAFLESDDSFKSDNLLKKVEIIQQYPDVKLIFNKTNCVWEDETRKLQRKIFEKNQTKLSKMTFPRNMFYDLYIDNLLLTFSSIIVEANTIKLANFDAPADAILDWWLWIHLAYKNEFYYINEELTNWRLHSNSYIRKSGKSAFCLAQVEAYDDIYKSNKKQPKLFGFILSQKIKLMFVRFYRLLQKIFLGIFSS